MINNSLSVTTFENLQPSGTMNFSRMDKEYSKEPIKRDKNKFYFEDLGTGKLENKRVYINDWIEIREFVGLNDVELENNELVIINCSEKTSGNYLINYNVLRIMAGMDGLDFSN